MAERSKTIKAGQIKVTLSNTVATGNDGTPVITYVTHYYLNSKLSDYCNGSKALKTKSPIKIAAYLDLELKKLEKYHINKYKTQG